MASGLVILRCPECPEKDRDLVAAIVRDKCNEWTPGGDVAKEDVRADDDAIDRGSVTTVTVPCIHGHWNNYVCPA